MRTVGEFKKAGLVFVDGDKGDHYCIGAAYAFNRATQWDDCTPESFAWRDNTGVKPEFDGLIDVYYTNDGGIVEGIPVERLLDSNSKDFYEKWRPHLPASIQTETPEEKEAFEAMNKSPYDVGAHVSDASKPVLPSVGHKLKFTHDIDGAFKHLHSEVYGWEHGDSLEVIHATENHHGEDAVIVLNTQSDVLTTAVIIDPSFFDDRTELEKAIDEMVATAVNSADDIAKSIIYEACVKLAKAGYAKPCSNNK